jgi:hypothetical protein
MANNYPKRSKLVAFLAQQVPPIAQKVPLVVTIGPLIYLGRLYKFIQQNGKYLLYLSPL